MSPQFYYGLAAGGAIGFILAVLFVEAVLRASRTRRQVAEHAKPHHGAVWARVPADWKTPPGMHRVNPVPPPESGPPVSRSCSGATPTRPIRIQDRPVRLPGGGIRSETTPHASGGSIANPSRGSA